MPKLALGAVVLGVSLVATALNQALLAQSGCRLTLLSRHLTFHVVEGESVVKHKWLQRDAALFGLRPGRSRSPRINSHSYRRAAGARNDPLFRETYTAWNCVHTRQQLLLEA